MTTFSLVAATNLCPYNWPALLLQRFGAPWVLCYISEVGKHFTARAEVLQAVLNTGSVFAEVAITCLCAALSPLKTNGGSVITPITQFRQKLSAVTPRKESGHKEKYTFTSA